MYQPGNCSIHSERHKPMSVTCLAYERVYFAGWLISGCIHRVVIDVDEFFAGTTLSEIRLFEGCDLFVSHFHGFFVCGLKDLFTVVRIGILSINEDIIFSISRDFQSLVRKKGSHAEFGYGGYGGNDIIQFEIRDTRRCFQYLS